MENPTANTQGITKKHTINQHTKQTKDREDRRILRHKTGVREFRCKSGKEKTLMTPKMKRRIKHELSAEKPTVWMGKHGVSQETLAEIEGQLERTEIVKINVLKTAMGGNNARAVAEKTAQQTKSSLVEVRGHTFILYRKKSNKTS
jgi:RNA-binding protein